MGKRGRKKSSTKPNWQEIKALREPDPKTDQFYVDKIQRKWISKDGTDIQYYVRWLGWPKSFNTWEKSSSFENCPEVLEEFEKAWEEKQKTKKKSQTHKSSVVKGTLKKTIIKKTTMSKRSSRRVTSYIKQSRDLKEINVENKKHDDGTEDSEDSPTDDECKKIFMRDVQTAEIKQNNKTDIKTIELLHPDLVIQRKHESVKFLGVKKIQGEDHYLARFIGDEQLVCFCSKIAKAFYEDELLEYLTAVSDYKTGRKNKGEFNRTVEYRMTYRS